MKTIAIGDRVFGKKLSGDSWRSVYGVVEAGKDGLINIQNNQVIDRCSFDEVESLPVAEWCQSFGLAVAQIDAAVMYWCYHDGHYETPDGPLSCYTIESWLRINTFSERKEMSAGKIN